MAYINGQRIDFSLLPGAITVDDELSDTSENPVQNKVVKEALDGKADGNVFIAGNNLVQIKMLDYYGVDILDDAGNTVLNIEPDGTLRSFGNGTLGKEEEPWEHIYGKGDGLTDVPKSALASGVQTSLGLADTALQPPTYGYYSYTFPDSAAQGEREHTFTIDASGERFAKNKILVRITTHGTGGTGNSGIELNGINVATAWNSHRDGYANCYSMITLEYIGTWVPVGYFAGGAGALWKTNTVLNHVNTINIRTSSTSTLFMPGDTVEIFVEE